MLRADVDRAAGRRRTGRPRRAPPLRGGRRRCRCPTARAPRGGHRHPRARPQPGPGRRAGSGGAVPARRPRCPVHRLVHGGVAEAVAAIEALLTGPRLEPLDVRGARAGGPWCRARSGRGPAIEVGVEGGVVDEQHDGVGGRQLLGACTRPASRPAGSGRAPRGGRRPAGRRRGSASSSATRWLGLSRQSPTLALNETPSSRMRLPLIGLPWSLSALKSRRTT